MLGLNLARFRNLLRLAVASSVIASCGDDAGGGMLSTTDGGGTVVGTEDGGGDGDPSGADSTGDGGDGASENPCDVDPALIGGGYEVVLEEVENVDVDVACDNAYLIGTTGNALNPQFDNFTVYVYRPALPGGAWPPGARPALFFSPGARQNIVELDENDELEHELYPDMLRALAAQGLVVFAVQPPFLNPDLGTLNWSSAKRANMLACAMLFAKHDAPGGWSQGGDARISEAALLSGHSRGGAATNFLVSNFESLQNVILGMNDYELCGAMPIAPLWEPEVEDVETSITVNRADSAPYLVLQGALDEDALNGGPASYDSMVREPEVDVDSALPGVQSPAVRIYDKAELWIHGVDHNAFGGWVQPWFGATRARSIAAHYMPEFVRWQLASDPLARAAFMKLMSPNPDEASFPPWPTTVDVDALWDDLPGFDLLDRPLVFANYVQRAGQFPDEARYLVDAWGRVDANDAPLPYGCATGAMGYLGTSTAGFPVWRTDGLVNAQACHGTTADILTQPGRIYQNVHETRALQVSWGEDLGSGGSILWELDDPEDVAELDVSDSHI